MVLLIINKKIFSIALIFILLSIIPGYAYASEINESQKVNVYFFWAEGCPHCKAEEPFLKSLEQKYENVEVHDYEITGSRENAELLRRVGTELDVHVSGVPFTVVGTQHFTGWHSEDTTGAAIEEAVRCAMENQCLDVVGSLTTPVTPDPGYEIGEGIPEKISLPLLGEVETKSLSLPVLTIIIAALDGFNPCAMWVLIFLISLLFDMKDRKKMWIFGTVFIAASAFVYFLFLTAWLNLFLFLGFILWIRIIIGLVAIGAGYHNLKEFVTNPSGACKVTGDEKRRKVFEKLKKIIHEKHFLIALGGLIVLAFAVNLVELICSAGLPAIYTQILTLTNLPAWQYYAYLALYIFVFMLDDLLVFIVAMVTLQLTGVTSKYSRASHLIGGIVMLIIGILMILKPELLMFG